METKSDKTLKPIALKTPLGFYYLDYDQIIMIEAKGNSSIVFTLGADSPIRTLYNLAFIEKKYCNNNLLRCHKSFIINLFHVEDLNLKAHQVHLKRNLIVPLSAHCLRLIKQMSINPQNLNNEKFYKENQNNQFSKKNKMYLFHKIIVEARVLSKHLKNIVAKILLSGFTLIIIILSSCEGIDKFYRPNLPEKLSAIGIIDIDDTLHNFSFTPEFEDDSNIIRSVTFEKSFQGEYFEELNDSLREFSFTVSSSAENLFYFQDNRTIKNFSKIKIPKNITFKTGEKYYLRASENETDEISAEVTVPSVPPRLEFISVERELIPLSPPLEGWEFDHDEMDTLKSAVVTISFNTGYKQRQFYVLLLKGEYHGLQNDKSSGYLDYSVRECSSPGFSEIMPGLRMLNFINPMDIPKISPVTAYFIDGSKIFSSKCYITLTTQFHGPMSNLARLTSHALEEYNSIRIKLLSIPEELYLFEKSLYTYNKVKDDPFSEPVYIRGNIEGGYGVFAICRSTELIINFDPPY